MKTFALSHIPGIWLIQLRVCHLKAHDHLNFDFRLSQWRIGAFHPAINYFQRPLTTQLCGGDKNYFLQLSCCVIKQACFESLQTSSYDVDYILSKWSKMWGGCVLVLDIVVNYRTFSTLKGNLTVNSITGYGVKSLVLSRKACWRGKAKAFAE